MSKKLIIWILIFGAFITSSDALFGQGRRRRRRQERRKEHQKKLRKLEEQKELQSEALTVIETIGFENAPYWIAQCALSVKECSDPEISGYKFKLVLHQFKECDQHFWEPENCTEICEIDRTTPGNKLINCTPNYPIHPIGNLLIAIIVAKIFLSIFH